MSAVVESNSNNASHSCYIGDLPYLHNVATNNERKQTSDCTSTTLVPLIPNGRQGMSESPEIRLNTEFKELHRRTKLLISSNLNMEDNSEFNRSFQARPRLFHQKVNVEMLLTTPKKVKRKQKLAYETSSSKPLKRPKETQY